MHHHTAHPLWYRIHSTAASVATLTATAIQYARDFTAAAAAQRAKHAEKEQERPLRFEDVVVEDGQRKEAVPDDMSIDSDASFSEHLARGAARVFSTPSLRKEQPAAVKRIVLDKTSVGKLMLCIRTGGGKSLTMYLTAISFGRITLVIIPLLSLTANQMERIKKAMQKDGVVVAVHLDDAAKHGVKENVFPEMDTFPYNSSTTMMILCSPEYIAENIDFRNALLRARDRHVLRLIVIDEVHIYAMHGRSFCDSIRGLQRDLFAKLYHGRKGYATLFLVMKATMPNSLISTLEKLTHIQWSKPCHQLRSTAKEFRQRYIDMEFQSRMILASLHYRSWSQY